MTFVDQTGGLGYAFGDIWRSADATYLMSTVTPNTIDLRGGTHSQTGDIVIDEGSATTFRTTFDNLGVAGSTVNGNVGQFFQSGVMRKTASTKEEGRFGVLGDADATINSKRRLSPLEHGADRYAHLHAQRVGRHCQRSARQWHRD